MSNNDYWQAAYLLVYIKVVIARPGIEVLIEKLLPKILERLGKEKPSKDAQIWCDIVSFGTISIRYVQGSSKISVCMQGRRGCCPVRVRIQQLLVQVSTAVWYVTKCDVTSHNTSTGLLGTFQASNIGQ